MRPRIPVGLVTVSLVLLATGAFVALAWLGVIPLESWFLFVLNQILSLVAVALLAAIGGIFLGMLLAHRMLATREFSPVERAMMESAQDVKALRERMERLEENLLARMDALEKSGEGKIRR